MKSTDEKVTEARKQLKAVGIKGVTVSKSNSCITFRVNKAVEVDLNKVNKIAEEFEDVSRDNNGEILSGGNTFTEITYGDKYRQFASNYWFHHIPQMMVETEKIKSMDCPSFYGLYLHRHESWNDWIKVNKEGQSEHYSFRKNSLATNPERIAFDLFLYFGKPAKYKNDLELLQDLSPKIETIEI